MTNTSSLWKYDRERDILWDNLFQMFKKNSFNGGLYFIDKIVTYRNELPVKEIIKLLHFALEWLNDSDKEFVTLSIELLWSSAGKYLL